MTNYKYVHTSPDIVVVQDEHGRTVDQHNMDEFIAAGGVPETVPWVEPVLHISTYQDKRRELYAPIEEQLDMQYKDAINGTTTWIDHITFVKTSVPKPQ